MISLLKKLALAALGVVVLAGVLRAAGSVKAQTASQLARQIVVPPEDLPFPAGASYSIPVGATSSLTAAYTYAPQIKGMSADMQSRYGTFNGGIATFLGQARKGIYFGFTKFAAIAGRWDISDPFAPGEPQVIRLSHGVYGGNGPLNDSGFAHDGHFTGAAVAENVDGTARFAFGHGMMFNNNQGAAVVNFDGQFSFGQSFNETDASRFPESPLLADESASGRAFFYAPGTVRFSGGNPSNGGNIGVWDMTDASGGFNPDDTLKKAGVISWANVGSLTMLNLPGQTNHVLAAKIGDVNGGGAATAEIRLAEISTVTGLPVPGKSYKTVQVPLTAAPYDLSKGNRELPLGDLQSAVVGGQSYLFVAEKFVPSSLSTLPFPGKLIIGVYRVSPADLTLSRVGSVSVDNTLMGYWKVMDATDGSSPFILAFSVTGKAGRAVGGKYYMDNDFAAYKTAPLFAGSTSTSVSAPSFIVPAEGFALPLQKGAVVTAQWPALGFIQPSGTTEYLYLYRNAFTFADATDELDYEFPDQQYKLLTPYDGHVAPGGLRGYVSLRIDRIDVNNLVTGGNVVPPDGGGGGGVFNFPILTLPPPPHTDDPCFNTFRNLCDAVETLRQGICGVAPGSPFCGRDFQY